MAKISGIPTSIAVDDSGGTARTISNDITNFTISTPRDMQVTTGLDKLAMERLLLVADASVTINGVFNADANMSHDVFKTVPSSSASRTVTIVLPPGGSGAPELEMEMLFEDYQIERGPNGSLSWSTTGRIFDGATVTWTTV